MPRQTHTQNRAQTHTQMRAHTHTHTHTLTYLGALSVHRNYGCPWIPVNKKKQKLKSFKLIFLGIKIVLSQYFHF